VASRSRARRTVAFAVGHAPGVLRQLDLPLRSRIPRRLAAWITERAQRDLMCRADVAVVNSEALQRRYLPMRPDVTLVRTSTREARFQHRADDRLDRDVVRFMLCGRVAEPKGIYEALDTFAHVRAAHLPNAELHVVGDGEHRTALERRVDEMGLRSASTFHGWVRSGEDLFALYREMDVLLHLSYAESFPRTVWEALAHSVLVVCTPVGGLADAFDDGTHVMFVPPRDADAAAGAIVRLIEDPSLRKRLIDAGFASSHEASLEHVSDRLSELMADRMPELRTTS
ncbi:MAG: glycosyltransferase family 4 protein, partial [Actinomycetota bacterium]